MNNALIVLAHGSRRESSALEIKEFAEGLQDISENKFKYVRAAFIQFCLPPFMDVVDELVELGVETIVVVPFFISAGNHVVEDIPELIVESKEKYPNLLFSVTEHFGKFPGLKNLILDEAGKF